MLDPLIELHRRLRDPQRGCAWDREQTLDSYRKYLQEEMQELLQAIEQRDPAAIAEELGDTLWNLACALELAREELGLDAARVIQGVTDKMIGRHPHVFGEATAATAEEAAKLYYAAKAREKNSDGV